MRRIVRSSLFAPCLWFHFLPHGVANACTFERDESVFVLEEPDVIISGNSTAICNARKECKGGIIRGCQTVICSGESSCQDTQILDVPEGGTVTCLPGPLTCWDVVIEAAPDASNVTVNCNGSCDDASIRGASKVECADCGSAKILDIPPGGKVNCDGTLSCWQATIEAVPGAVGVSINCTNGCDNAIIRGASKVDCNDCSSAKILDIPDTGVVNCVESLACLLASIQADADASILVNCFGSSGCRGASINAGATGIVDCVGGCESASIQISQTVKCTTDLTCSGTTIHGVVDGGSVFCSGWSGCFNANIKPADGASILVECSGRESCSVAVIDAGAEGKVVCSGTEACVGNWLYVDYTIIKSKCMECGVGSCTFPCYFTAPGQGRQDCIDGAENGECEAGVEERDQPTGSPTRASWLSPTDFPSVALPDLATEAPTQSVDQVDQCQVDDATWFVKNRMGKKRRCAWVGRRAKRRCMVRGKRNRPAFEACPQSCGDSAEWLGQIGPANNRRTVDCSWVSRKPARRCRKRGSDEDRTRAFVGCASSCCEFNKARRRAQTGRQQSLNGVHSNGDLEGHTTGNVFGRIP